MILKRFQKYSHQVTLPPLILNDLIIPPVITKIGSDWQANVERGRLNRILASIEQKHYESGTLNEGIKMFDLGIVQENYNAYKINYKKNLKLDPDASSFGNTYIFCNSISLFIKSHNLKKHFQRWR